MGLIKLCRDWLISKVYPLRYRILVGGQHMSDDDQTDAIKDALKSQVSSLMNRNRDLITQQALTQAWTSHDLKAQILGDLKAQTLGGGGMSQTVGYQLTSAKHADANPHISLVNRQTLKALLTEAKLAKVEIYPEDKQIHITLDHQGRGRTQWLVESSDPLFIQTFVDDLVESMPEAQAK